MPSLPDLVQFLGGNAFGRPCLPNATFAGKTIIITGSNTGLGFDAATHIVQLGVSRLILACRSVEKGEAARKQIYKATGSRAKTTIEVWEVDLSKYDSVLAFAQRVDAKLDRVDGFVANAGVELVKFTESEGLETTLTVNAVSTFLMALAVLPKLQATADEQKQDTVLSFTGSCVHAMAPVKQLSSISATQDPFDTLSDPKTADMDNRYPLSKLIEHQLFNALSARVDGVQDGKAHRVNLNLIDPGWCESGLSRNRDTTNGERFASIIFKRTQEKGSRTLVHGVSCGREANGKYLSNCGIKPQSSYVNSKQGKEDSERLWKAFVKRVQGIAPESVKALA